MEADRVEILRVAVWISEGVFLAIREGRKGRF